MKQFLLNIWNAQRNAEKLRVLGCYRTAIADVMHQRNLLREQGMGEFLGERMDCIETLKKENAELRGRLTEYAAKLQQRNLGNRQPTGLENKVHQPMMLKADKFSPHSEEQGDQQ